MNLGEPEELKVGAFFQSRIEIKEAGYHSNIQKGISGTQKDGCDAIVISEDGYEDDSFQGDVIIYTGEGGRDQETKKQVSNQELVRGNLALVVSFERNLPIRVFQQVTVSVENVHSVRNSLKRVYKYVGLYVIENYWSETGISGFLVWKFRLISIRNIKLFEYDHEININQKSISEPVYNYAPKRYEIIVNRINRETVNSKLVKSLYDFKCQVCGIRIETPAGFYIEAAHIIPLGKPHNGPDIIENLLCLCPNHHVMFDTHCFSINTNFELLGIEGKIIVKPNHNISPEYLKYHTEHFFNRNKK